MGQSASTPPTGPDGPLARLAAERATGALHFPGGRIRLRDGAVSWVECDDLPGSAAPAPPREGGRPRRPRQGRTARGGAGGQARATGPESLVLRQIRHLTVLLDAAFLVLPLPAEGTSFTSGAEHCPAAVRQVGVAALLRAVAARRAQLDAWRTWAAVDGAPVVLAPDTRREDGPGWRARLLLGGADGRRTPAGLAQTLGHSVFWTLVEVRRLAAGGLIVLPEGTAAADTATAGGTGTTGGTDPSGGAETGGGTSAAGRPASSAGKATTGGRKTGGGPAAGGGKSTGRAAKTGGADASGAPEASGGRPAGRSGGGTTRPGGSGRPRSGGEKRSGTAGRERSGPDKRSGTTPPLPTRGGAGGRDGGLPTRTPAGGRSGGAAPRAAGRERDTERPTHSAADDGGEAPGTLPRRRPGVCLEEAREREPQPAAGVPGLPSGLPETADPDVTLLTRLRTALEENL
ncbi:hypothetical protein [Streptomyces catenulae]|uniref:Translation initiation factor IF-2 n=1 Tax=Streptomyces catenulae TaxID=66875 RepID=A0ABV2Z643_9ACTN|nr:hypothetical protein [Streptomyces catenulae]